MCFAEKSEKERDGCVAASALRALFEKFFIWAAKASPRLRLVRKVVSATEYRHLRGALYGRNTEKKKTSFFYGRFRLRVARGAFYFTCFTYQLNRGCISARSFRSRATNKLGSVFEDLRFYSPQSRRRGCLGM